jgi:hypothetical protein
VEIVVRDIRANYTVSNELKKAENKLVPLETCDGKVCLDPNDVKKIGYAFPLFLRSLFEWEGSRITLKCGIKFRSPKHPEDVKDMVCPKRKHQHLSRA